MAAPSSASRSRFASMSRMGPVGRLVLLSLGGLGLFGACAAWANHGHGAAAATHAFWVQGCSSAFTTMLIGSVVEGVRRWLGDGRAASIVASVGGACAALCFHISVNVLAHTPEVLRTVAPPGIMAFVFSGAYVIGTRRERMPLEVDR